MTRPTDATLSALVLAFFVVAFLAASAWFPGGPL